MARETDADRQAREAYKEHVLNEAAKSKASAEKAYADERADRIKLTMGDYAGGDKEVDTVFAKEIEAIDQDIEKRRIARMDLIDRQAEERLIRAERIYGRD